MPTPDSTPQTVTDPAARCESCGASADTRTRDVQTHAPISRYRGVLQCAPCLEGVLGLEQQGWTFDPDTRRWMDPTGETQQWQAARTEDVEVLRAALTEAFPTLTVEVYHPYAGVALLLPSGVRVHVQLPPREEMPHLAHVFDRHMHLLGSRDLNQRLSSSVRALRVLVDAVQAVDVQHGQAPAEPGVDGAGGQVHPSGYDRETFVRLVHTVWRIMPALHHDWELLPEAEQDTHLADLLCDVAVLIAYLTNTEVEPTPESFKCVESAQRFVVHTDLDPSEVQDMVVLGAALTSAAHDGQWVVECSRSHYNGIVRADEFTTPVTADMFRPPHTTGG
jgi:hypothetical protein